MTDIQKKAHKDFKKGMKAADIAAKYDIPAATVRTWINRKWKEKSVSSSVGKVETKNSKKLKQKSALKGNKNALGNSGGAPERNQNNLKHGAYAKVFMDALFEDETELLDDIATDDKIVLEQTIVALTIRERRLMKEVKRLKEESAGNKNLILGSVMKIQGVKDGENENKAVTTAEAVFTALRIYESELTKVQSQKAKLAVELAKIVKGKADNQKINELKQIFSPDIVSSDSSFNKDKGKNND